MIKDIRYFFRRKYRQIRRVIDFLPMIWNGFDFDYMYAIELFEKQTSTIDQIKVIIDVETECNIKKIKNDLLKYKKYNL